MDFTISEKIETQHHNFALVFRHCYAEKCLLRDFLLLIAGSLKSHFIYIGMQNRYFQFGQISVTFYFAESRLQLLDGIVKFFPGKLCGDIFREQERSFW